MGPEGDTHGVFIDDLAGFAVCADTFRNTGDSTHKDVFVMTRTDAQTAEVMIKGAEGCDANVRYHATRGDFSVDASSRIRVRVTATGLLDVDVDAHNTGEWTNCTEVQRPKKLQDALPEAYLGLTASTGQLADNHDILSLTTF